MNRQHELAFLLESLRGGGTETERARWRALVAADGELATLESLVDWLSTGPTWNDHPTEEAHVSAMVLARAAEDGERLFLVPDLLAHLGRCDDCLDAFSAALHERVEAEGSGAAPRRRGLTLVGPWLAAAASLLFCVSLFWLNGDSGTAGSVRALAHIEPLPVKTLRSESSASEFDAAYARGLEHYAATEYAAALPFFARALALDGGRHEARLYLGSSLLLEGDAPRAAEALRRATDTSVVPAIRDEALWLLAQAYLRQNLPERALDALAARRPDAARHASATREQLEALRAR
ncbi:MAG: hypothetical protein WD226_05960 [Planctomycetota bacterium]